MTDYALGAGGHHTHYVEMYRRIHGPGYRPAWARAGRAVRPGFPFHDLEEAIGKAENAQEGS